ncbi:mediator of RNA polymerase II transcription subunit 22-like [Limulus polyphemus]|uniref:Mediator of RNA polymerase II transcription subunit 22 n=1 Tax=Limulus polyphemus TaxID=6850 RepID=A0ABM1BY84_LIMPO|nr:mediator of RNA polymerase II transcription subunit 22-like [Limulus polyphemus]
MSQQKTLSQNKEALLKSYNKRMKDDIKSMVDNFIEIIKLARVPQDEDSQVLRPLQNNQDQYEMHVRACNVVRAGECLMKLISDIKQYLVLNDFPSINEAISQNTRFDKNMQNECDSRLCLLRDDVASELYELEEEYYSSAYK